VFDVDAMADLTASIRQKGIVQPLIVRPAGDGRYEIVAGERRWRAAQAAKLHAVPVVIRDFSDSEMLEIAIIENIQRADLNALDEAQAYRQLMDRFGHTQEKIAEGLSRSRSHIANLLRLLNLPDDVQDMLRDGRLSAGHARTLVGNPLASELAHEIVTRGMSVRDAEALVRKPDATATKAPRGAARTKDADTRAIEQDLSASLKMAVDIQHNESGNNGVLQVKYASLDDLDVLCRALSVASRDFSQD
jgi:ParB family chromosome partitioning protein